MLDTTKKLGYVCLEYFMMKLSIIIISSKSRLFKMTDVMCELTCIKNPYQRYFTITSIRMDSYTCSLEILLNSVIGSLFLMWFDCRLKVHDCTVSSKCETFIFNVNKYFDQNIRRLRFFSSLFAF